jgi:hypothetical protein
MVLTVTHTWHGCGSSRLEKLWNGLKEGLKRHLYITRQT